MMRGVSQGNKHNAHKKEQQARRLGGQKTHAAAGASATKQQASKLDVTCDQRLCAVVFSKLFLRLAVFAPKREAHPSILIFGFHFRVHLWPQNPIFAAWVRGFLVRLIGGGDVV